jgi:peroxiredoxin
MRIVAAVIAVCLSVLFAVGSAEAGDAPGRAAPKIELRDTRNVAHTLAQYKGKVVLVNFWATWCGPCATEMPHLERMWKELGPKGFVVLGISVDKAGDQSKVGPFAATKGVTYPILLDPQTVVSNVYNPSKSAPFNVIVDRAGNIHSTHAGYNPGDEVKLRAEVEALLGAN